LVCPPESQHSQDQHDSIFAHALTFADVVEQVRFGACGLSRALVDRCNMFATDRLYPNIANWRYRNVAELQAHDRQRGHALAAARRADDDQPAAASSMKPTPSTAAKAPSSV